MVKNVPKDRHKANRLIAEAVRRLWRAQRFYERDGKGFPASVLKHHAEGVEHFLKTEL